ncbi:MAG: hypothetical protein LBB84_01870 [Tannerellaceae bacterium]|jgi:hypothetical protein|nr:hypothetical protein [Tannerellaceae bacterium]
MQKISFYFLFVILLVGTLACNKDESIRLSGKPDKITCSDNTAVSFSYQDDRLLRITESGSGSTIEFDYEGGELSGLSYRPTDPRMADGTAYQRFQKTGERKITVESGGEPALDSSRMNEIELDAEDFPIKITEAGIYSIGGGGVITKVREGEYYTLFTWDTSTKQLLKKETCRIETSEVVATYTYRYDNAPGIMSQIDCPIWLYTYWNHERYYALGTYHALFFGHTNNLVEATIEDELNDRHEVLTYIYNYSPEGFPVSVSIQRSGAETMAIQIRY